MSHVDLSLILGRFTTDALRKVRSKVHDRDIENSLYRWIKTLPEPIHLSPRVSNSRSNPRNPYNFECRQINVLYLVSLILLYRSRTVEGPFPVAAVIASSTIAGIFEEFLARDEVRLLGPVFTFHLLAAGIALLSCYKYSNFWAIAQEDIKVVAYAQEELKKKWPSALGSIRSFERMHKLAITTQQKVIGRPETKLTREQAVLFENIDINLCRMWNVLQQADVVSSDFGASNTGGNMMSQQPAVGITPVLDYSLPAEPVLPPAQGEASFGQLDFDEALYRGSSQLNDAVGDWLFWDQTPLNFS